MKRLAALIERNSDGRMKAEIYPASRLGSIPHQIEGAQLGSIQIVLSAPEFLVGIDPRFELLAAPGMFHNDNQVIKAITRRVSQAWRRGDSTSLERRLG
jgi:TRAP-type transport system periplasmic protein